MTNTILPSSRLNCSDPAAPARCRKRRLHALGAAMSSYFGADRTCRGASSLRTVLACIFGLCGFALLQAAPTASFTSIPATVYISQPIFISVSGYSDGMNPVTSITLYRNGTQIGRTTGSDYYSLTVSLTDTAPSTAQTVTYTAVADDDNYSSPTASATVSVLSHDQQTLTLVGATSQVYGTEQVLSTTGGSGSGAVSYAIVNQSAAGVATLTGSGLIARSGTGWVMVQATKASDGTYNAATSNTVTVTFSKAALTITANDASRAYGANNPTFIATYTGLMPGDTASVVSGLTLSSSATSTSNSGSYAIAASGATASNYNITLVNGSLTVTKAYATITLSGFSQTYDGSAKPVTATTSPANLGVVITYNGSTTAPPAIGSYSVVAAINDSNYQGSATGILAISSSGQTTQLAATGYGYDGTTGRLKCVLAGSTIFDYAYHTGSDLVETVTQRNGSFQRHNYWASFRDVTDVVSTTWGSTAKATFTYGYDWNPRQTCESVTGDLLGQLDPGNTNALMGRYLYTARSELDIVYQNRLTDTNALSNPGLNIGTEMADHFRYWSYDNALNRTTEARHSPWSTTYTTNANNQYTALSGSQTVASITYDADGNITGDGVWNYIWDDENRLRQMTDVNDGNHWISFKYDYQNRRVEKAVKQNGTTTTTRYLWEGSNMVAEFNPASSSTMTATYLWGLDTSGSLGGAGGVGGLLMVTQSGGNAFPVYDSNGNVRAYLNGSGGFAAVFDHGTFGEKLSSSVTGSYFFRFASKYYDEETGLYQYNERYYSPNLGRFINRDPIEEGGGVNLYGYCANDGINQSDYLGMDPPYDGNIYSGSNGGNNGNPTSGGGSSGSSSDVNIPIPNIQVFPPVIVTQNPGSSPQLTASSSLLDISNAALKNYPILQAGYMASTPSRYPQPKVLYTSDPNHDPYQIGPGFIFVFQYKASTTTASPASTTKTDAPSTDSTSLAVSPSTLKYGNATWDRNNLDGIFAPQRMVTSTVTGRTHLESSDAGYPGDPVFAGQVARASIIAASIGLPGSGAVLLARTAIGRLILYAIGLGQFAAHPDDPLNSIGVLPGGPAAKILLSEEQGVLAVVKDGVILAQTGDVMLSHAEFVRRTVGTLPAGAEVVTIGKLEGQIIAIRSPTFHVRQLPASQATQQAAKAAFK